jgi:hypothetical protein
MPYPWPIADADSRLGEALDIALDYLEYSGQAFPYSETQRTCAHVIMEKWRAGVRHPIRLANYAIVAVEQGPRQENIRSLYPRVF